MIGLTGMVSMAAIRGKHMLNSYSGRGSMSFQHRRVSWPNIDPRLLTNRSSFATPIRRPAPVPPPGTESVYRALITSKSIECGALLKFGAQTPRGVAIVPTAVSGGGDIMCALKLAKELQSRGIGPIRVLVKMGVHKDRNAALVSKIQNSPIAAGIEIYAIEALPRDFQLPDLVIAGPGSNESTEGLIAEELSKVSSPAGRADSFGSATISNFYRDNKIEYLQMEEPGFIEGQYRFNLDPKRHFEMSTSAYGLGLPLQSSEFVPITSIFDQRPERLLELKDPWLKTHLLGASPESGIETYAQRRMLSLVYHHIDYVLERSVYVLAATAEADSRDIDIVAKVWDPTKPHDTQVAWTLNKSHEPQEPGMPRMLDKELLRALGVKEVMMVRKDRTETMTVGELGKTIRIIDPFPMDAGDMDLVREAAIPIQGCSGLMSISRSIELNKIPLLEVLHDNRHFFKQLISIVDQVDPKTSGLGLVLRLGEVLIENIDVKQLMVWSPVEKKYVVCAEGLGSVDMKEKVPGLRDRPIAKYIVASGTQNEVVASEADYARVRATSFRPVRQHGAFGTAPDAASECVWHIEEFKKNWFLQYVTLLKDPIKTFKLIGEIIRSPEYKDQVEQFNRFIVTECSLYDRLADKIAYYLKDVPKAGNDGSESGGIIGGCISS